ncbi:PepSY domain-containing protein [Maritimibacter sp. UBA3975]|uniref:PepSY domain-containing protein n=1 Tax=Maritimibacter sp. UBA3975 TaxID=1946833 RepID=UPI000C0B6CAE|nr:PepSY domain-containing protein [Maritimibacter sp. UBA3975]MAM63846.1 hypothetical protein [Maritimibacter sp.]|tara:strand:+ start:90373 stop:90735 length:363 start_codon:yes stop_codon:yes gene_type:complete
MRKTVLTLGFVFAAPMGAALADDDCFVPMVDWQPRDAVAEYAREQGWTPQRIKIDDGCYEIEGLDAEGREIEVKLHPKTFEVVEFEYEDDDHGRGRHGDRETDRDRDRDQTPYPESEGHD